VNILFVSRAFPPGGRHGGSFTVQRVLGEALALRGHRVTLVTGDLFDPGVPYPPDRLLESHRGIDVHRLPARWRRHWDSTPRRGRAAFLSLAEGADVVHVFGARHPNEHLAVRAARIRDAALILMPQGEVPSRGRARAAKRLFDGLVERRRYARADVVLAVSGAEAAGLSAWGADPARIRVLPEFAEPLPPPSRGADAVRAELGVPPQATLLAWCGRLHPIKGLDLLFDALSGRSGLAGVHAVILGEEGLPGAGAGLRSQVASLGLSDRVHFLGWADETRKADVFAASDAFVLVSLYESFSRAAAEALLAGLPLLVADTCGIADHAGGAAIVFPRTPAALSEAIAALAGDPVLRRRLRGGVAREGARFAPAAAAEALVGWYAEAISSRRPGRARATKGSPLRFPAPAR
jgi:glycosyltransferase involved in cell wall biosynthesis